MNNLKKLPYKISSQILTIGPEHLNHRGGIGAVIDVYSRNFKKFKFIATYRGGNSFDKPLFFINSIYKLFSVLINDHEIKIVHIHGASYGSFYRKFILFIITKYIFKKKVIYHIHGGEYHLFYIKSNKLNKKFIKLFINNVDCLICLSNNWKCFFEKNFTPKKIETVSNIIDYPNKDPYNKKSTIITLLFLGLISNNKGIFDLLKIIYENKAKYTGRLRLIIGGNGETERLKDLIKCQQMEGIVEFVGWIAGKEKTSWLQKANIYILPSYNEGVPISILEAMSYSQAIISSNVGGIPEIVILEKNGILIEPGNLEEIKSAIDFYIEHPEIIEVYGNESKSITKKYLPESVMKELMTIYTSLMKN